MSHYPPEAQDIFKKLSYPKGGRVIGHEVASTWEPRSGSKGLEGSETALRSQPGSHFVALRGSEGVGVPPEKSTSKNMDKLWRHFHSKQNYPKFYLGIAKKTAICKCPDTEEEEWYNGDRNLSVADPKKGETVTVTLTVNTGTYSKDFVFMGWVKQPVHEWKMESGSVLQLEQRFVDGLLPEDKKYLRMTA